MNNTLNTVLLILCTKLNKKSLFIVLLGALIFTSNLAHAQLPAFYDFETGLQGWTNNGNRSGLFNNSTWSCNSNRSIFSRGTRTNRNIMTSPAINLTAYTNLEISFCHISFGLDNNEGFRLEFYDGSNWVLVQTFTFGNDFFTNGNNNQHDLTATLTDATYNFASNSRFRFSGTANNDNEWNFFDTIEINTPPCLPSTANGSTTLACPSVESGGLGLSGSDVTFNCYENDVTLEASYLDLGETTSYSIENIPYNPPFQYGCLENPISVNVDDVWSPVIDLPFDFCFYGNTYDSCVVGSNGIVSFDTSLANNATGWSILTQIPSLINASDYQGPGNSRRDYYFGPSIFGVHHDVDPSVGGEIGYQLITLNTGCRALVAAWSDVPMYADNSKRYSGMIVFYEDTNVIEVYIRDKPIDATWNSGRAAVGLQANSTEGIAAPGRNSLDTPWGATNEAWRFTPNGNSITELKWYENSVSVANEIIDPNNDGQITVSPTNTTTYISQVTYNLCNGSNLIETDETVVTVSGGKQWNGSINTNWNNPNNWTPFGVPAGNDCIEILPASNTPVLTGSTNGRGYNLEIVDGAVLTQQPESTLTIEDRIIIAHNGALEIRDDASLIQITDVPVNQNIGVAKVQREATDVNNYDYVYWSTPVDAFHVGSISPGTPSSVIFEWIPTVPNGTIGDHGSWANTSENMIPGKGYIVRGLQGTPIANTAEFQGKLNNGQISTPISRGNYTGTNYNGVGNLSTSDDDNWNLLGNPYPSAISLSDFVGANPNIDGTLYFWRHLNGLSTASNSPFYENYTYNYDVNDYIASNSLGSSPPGFSGYIASGQGFFALMLDSASTPNTVTFSNTMRNAAYRNDNFYRNADLNLDEKHRIWLDLVRHGNTAISILVGFIEGATNDLDRLYDGISINDAEHQFYSVQSNEKLTIQGKALPFNGSETFNLGFKTPTTGNFAISINQLDGLFENSNQDIYIEDTELNIIHDLKVSPYTFTSDAGTFNTRFILRFTAERLSVKDQELLSNLVIQSNNKSIKARSDLSPIQTFELYDITGRAIHRNLKINQSNYRYQTHNLSEGTYIVKVQLANGAAVSKKMII